MLLLLDCHLVYQFRVSSRILDVGGTCVYLPSPSVIAYNMMCIINTLT